MSNPVPPSLQGWRVAITRPHGSATAWVARVRAAGGEPVRLPGLSLRAVADRAGVAAALERVLSWDLLVFTSPAAVAHARALHPLATTATVCAVGKGTARALARAGVARVNYPDREDSEGLLAMDALSRTGDMRVALVGAAGGRGLLRDALRQRSGAFEELHVYQRGPARLDARHRIAAAAFTPDDVVLLSSGEALGNLQHALAGEPWQALRGSRWVVSSERLAALARATGIGAVTVASSPNAAGMLDAAARSRD